MLAKPPSGFKFTSGIPTKSISLRQVDVCARQVHLPAIHGNPSNIPSGNGGYSIFRPISSPFGNCCPDHSPNSKFPTSLYSRHVKSPDYSFKERSYPTFPQLKYHEKVFDLRVTPWRSEISRQASQIPQSFDSVLNEVRPTGKISLKEQHGCIGYTKAPTR
jgi:hypothetical protein